MRTKKEFKNIDVDQLVNLIINTTKLNIASKFTLIGINETGSTSNYLKSGEFDKLVINALDNNSTNVGDVESTYGTVVEEGDSNFHKTTITLAGDFAAISGGANLALGRLIYTFPNGTIRINSVFMNGIALQETDGNINADTPDVGIGTTIASGAVAVLSGTAAFENILTGQTFTDCDGTAERVGASSTLILTAADDHTVHFNIADGWAASGDGALGFTGDIIITWELLS